MGQIVYDRSANPEMIADMLRVAILRGRLSGGKPLRQDELAGEFGVSRIPVREALRQLTAEGLVAYHPRCGAVVAALRPDEAEEILEIRATLEIKAVTLGMPLWGAATLDALGPLLDEAETCADIDRWSDLNWMFHESLYSAANRPRLLGLIKSLHANVDRYIRLLVSRSDYRQQAEREHRAILACAQVHNLAALAALIEQHAMQTAVQLRQFLETERKDEHVQTRSKSALRKRV